METNRGSSMTISEFPVGANYQLPVSTISIEQATAANTVPTMETNAVPVSANLTTSAVQVNITNSEPNLESNKKSPLMSNGIPSVLTIGTRQEQGIIFNATYTVPATEANGLPHETAGTGVSGGAPIVATNVAQGMGNNAVSTLETNGVLSLTVNQTLGSSTHKEPTKQASVVGASNIVPIMNSIGASNAVPAMKNIGASNTVPAMKSIGASNTVPDMKGIGASNIVPTMKNNGASNTVSTMKTIGAPTVSLNPVSCLSTNDTQVVTSYKTSVSSSNVKHSASIVGINIVSTIETCGAPTMTTNSVPCLSTEIPVIVSTNTPVLSSCVEKSTSTIASDVVPAVETCDAPTMTTNTVPCLKTNEIPVVSSNVTPVLFRSIENSDSTLMGIYGVPIMTNTVPCLTTNGSPLIDSTDKSVQASSMEQSSPTNIVNIAPTTGISGVTNCASNSFPGIAINEVSSVVIPRVAPPISSGVSTLNNAVLSVATVGTKPSWSHYVNTMRVPRMQFHPYIPSLDGVTRRRTWDPTGRECPVHSSCSSSQVRSTFHLRHQKTVSAESCYRPTPSQVHYDKPESEQVQTTNNIKLLQKQLNDAICVGNLRAKYARLLYGNQQFLDNLTKPMVTQDSGYGDYLQDNSTPQLCYNQSMFASNLTHGYGEDVPVQPTALSTNSQLNNGTNLHSQDSLYAGHSVVSPTLGQNSGQDIGSQNNTLPAVHSGTLTDCQHDNSMQSFSMSEVFPPVQQYSNRSCIEGAEPDFSSASFASPPADPSLFALNLLPSSRQSIQSQNRTPFAAGQPTLPFAQRQDQETESQADAPLMNVHANSKMLATTNLGNKQTPCNAQADVGTDTQTRFNSDSEIISSTIVQQTSVRSFLPQSQNQRNYQYTNTNNATQVSHSILANSLNRHSQTPVGTWSPVYNPCQLLHPYPEQAAPVALIPSYNVPLPGCAVPLSPHLSLPPNYGPLAHSDGFGYNLQMQDSQLLPNIHAHHPASIVPHHQPYLAQEVHMAPSIDTQQLQGQRVLPNLLAPSLQPTVNPYPNPYLMFSAANLLFTPTTTHYKEQESNQQLHVHYHTSNQQQSQDEEQPVKENSNREQVNVPNEEEVDVQQEEEVDVQYLPSPPLSSGFSSRCPSPQQQRWRSKKIYTKKVKNKPSNTRDKKEDKLHKCSICGKSYSRAFTLKTHYRVHTGEKPYKCSFCTKQFTQSGGLDSHLPTHTGEKPYQCRVCNREFSHSAAVKNHMRIHTGAKPFVCDLGCGKSFADCSTLTKHRRVHTGEKPFECRECGAKFTQTGNMNKHLNKLHGIERPSGAHLL